MFYDANFNFLRLLFCLLINKANMFANEFARNKMKSSNCRSNVETKYTFQVEVYGDYTNIAQDGIADQISTHSWGEAFRCIDNNTNGAWSNSDQ